MITTTLARRTTARMPTVTKRTHRLARRRAVLPIGRGSAISGPRGSPAGASTASGMPATTLSRGGTSAGPSSEKFTPSAVADTCCSPNARRINAAWFGKPFELDRCDARGCRETTRTRTRTQHRANSAVRRIRAPGGRRVLLLPSAESREPPRAPRGGSVDVMGPN